MPRTNVTINAMQQDMSSDEIMRRMADLYNAPEERFNDLAKALLITKQPYVLLENVEESLAAEHRKALSELGFECQSDGEFYGLSLVPVEQSKAEVVLCPACDQPTAGEVQCPSCDVVIEKYLSQKKFDEKFQRESNAVSNSEIAMEKRYKERSEKEIASKKAKKQSNKTEAVVETPEREDHLLDGSVSSNEKPGRLIYVAVATVCLTVIGTGYIAQGLISQESENDDSTVDSNADSAATTQTSLVDVADSEAASSGSIAPDALVAVADNSDTEALGTVASEANISDSIPSGVASSDVNTDVTGLTDADLSLTEATLTTMSAMTGIVNAADQGSIVAIAGSTELGVSIEEIASSSDVDIDLSDIAEAVDSLSSSTNPSDLNAPRTEQYAAIPFSTDISGTVNPANKRLNRERVNSSSLVSVEQTGILDATSSTVFGKKWQQEKKISGLQQRVKRWHQRDMLSTAAVIVSSKTDPLVRFSGTQEIIKLEGLKSDTAEKLKNIHTLALLIDSDIERMGALINLSSTYSQLELHADSARIDDEITRIEADFAGSPEERIIADVLLAKYKLDSHQSDTALSGFQSAKAHVSNLDSTVLANSALSYIALSEATQGLTTDANTTSNMIKNADIRSSLQIEIDHIAANQTELAIPKKAAAHARAIPDDAGVSH